MKKREKIALTRLVKSILFVLKNTYLFTNIDIYYNNALLHHL